MLTLDQMHRHWPHCPEEFAVGVVDGAPEAFSRFYINTALRQAHFMAQISHECGAGTDIIESLNYTHVQRIMAVWPNRFPTYMSAIPFVGKPEILADKVYNGRMGNRPGSTDGWDYRGRGCLQITGRDSYVKYAAVCGVAIDANPDLAINPEYSILIAAAEFEGSGCNKYADRDNLTEVSALINIGHLVINPDAIEGLSSRGSWLKLWKHELNA
jgi:putative chitinase